MTDWSDVVRDNMDHWCSRTGRCPDPVKPVNGQYSRALWVRAAMFCEAVADGLQAEAEADEREREFELRVALARLANDADAHTDLVGEIIRTVREHDA